MKILQARSFVQVHYHNRPGGVNTVIGHYTVAFAEALMEVSSGFARQSPVTNLVVCKRDKTEGRAFLPGTIQNIPESGYCSFATKYAFLKTKEILVGGLLAIIQSPAVKKPLCIVGHNLTLGKNCALSSAFAHCARLCENGKNDVRFFSVIHDFAEEGRIDCLKQIYDLQDLGIGIWNDLYPKAKNLRYIALNNRNHALLKKAGFIVDLLRNPVQAGRTKRGIAFQEKKTAYKRLIRYSKREQGAIDPTLPTLFYPARVISRKNVIEAILVSNIICKANLLMGKGGPSPEHRALYAKTRNLCVKHKAEVVFNSSAAFAPQIPENGFPSILYDVADACISTSIVEGFGYAFFDSWIKNKCIIGRKPLDFSPLPGMKFPGLYTRLPIPVSWILMHDLAQKYYNRIRQYYPIRNLRAFSSFAKFKFEFIAAFIKNDAIDFACLDETMQLDVLNKLFQSQSMAIEWEKLCGKELKRIRDSIKIGLQPEQSLIRLNRNQIKKKVSGEEFVRNFIQCFFKTRPAGVSQNRYKEITRYFGELSRFRLLLTPE